MNDIRQFLRYTLPGITFGLELFLFFLLSHGSKVIDKLEPLFIDKGMASVLIAFFASGALGYICSIIYFSMAWGREHAKFWSQNHMSTIDNMIDKLGVRIFDGRYNNISSKPYADQLEAWAIFNHIWLCRRDGQPIIKETDIYVDRLVNIMHGMGATFIGTMIAFIVWICVSIKTDFILSSVENMAGHMHSMLLVISIETILLIVLYKQHNIVKKNVERLVHSALMTSLSRELPGKNDRDYFFIK